MAETDYAQGAAPVPERANISTLVNVAGAVMSMALMAGVGVWGYKLLLRDVTGVPVVRAVEGPMRIAPDDPGGRPADHQGLAVNDVAAQGSAAAPADRLVLAPQPVRLMDEDQPQTGQAPTEPTVIATSLPAPSQTPVQPSDSVTALVDQLTRGVEPLLPSADKNEEEVVARLETPTAPPPPTLTEDTASNEPEDDPATPESEPETMEVA
ncbi:MAG: SPOR domain-containing protein, partial [Paracoccaceae bacterium]